MLPIIFAAFVFCFVLERLRPGWRLPRVRGWWRRPPTPAASAS